jgi:hypothetical protein
VQNILAVPGKAYYATAEVIDGTPAIDPAEYCPFTTVFDRRYAQDLSKAFRANDISGLGKLTTGALALRLPSWSRPSVYRLPAVRLRQHLRRQP